MLLLIALTSTGEGSSYRFTGKYQEHGHMKNRLCRSMHVMTEHTLVTLLCYMVLALPLSIAVNMLCVISKWPGVY